MAGFVVLVLIIVALVVISTLASDDASRSRRRSSGSGSVRVQTRSLEPRSATDLIPESRRAWVPPGKEVEVEGRTVSDGMIYVGGSLSPQSRLEDVDPALIDPRLSARSKRADRSGQYLDYWPSYHDLPKSSRAAYLDWLADGRRQPDTPIGYVFLFFYGLERRILLDAQVSESAEQDVPRLLEELDRLLSIYDDDSFQRYGTGLREYAATVYGAESTSADAGSVQYRIGRHLAAGEPVPGRLAARWLEVHSEFYGRTPWKRCRSAFNELFVLRYEEKYGEGLQISAPGPSMEVEYHTASRGITDNFSHQVDDAVQPGRVNDFKEPVLELADEVQEELDDYSRWIGRRDDRSSPAAVGLLPPELVPTFAGEKAENLIETIEQRIGDDGRAVVPSEWLTDRWPTKNDGYMTGKEAEALTGFLEGYRIGIEPDIRYTRNPSKRDYVALFRLPDEARAPGEKFRGARLLIHLASAVAAADDSVTEDEERHLEAHLERGLDLHSAERARLRAHMARRLTDPPTLRGVRSRAEKLEERQRRQLGRFLITVAGADGYLDGDEVRLLEKIYDILGFGEDAVHGDLHDMSARTGTDRGPVTVLEQDEKAEGHAIPEPEDAQDEAASEEGITLDRDRLASIQAETREVGQVLEGVFADEDETSDEPERPDHTFSTDGLDEAHAVFLEELITRDKWARSAFDELAERHDLMPGFALEQINQVAFEVADEPLLEGEDPVEVNSYALEALRQ